jgi:hypothetical protein
MAVSLWLRRASGRSTIVIARSEATKQSRSATAAGESGAGLLRFARNDAQLHALAVDAGSVAMSGA